MAILVLFNNYISASNNSFAIYKANRNSLLTGDFREAKRSLASGAHESCTLLQGLGRNGAVLFQSSCRKKEDPLWAVNFTYFINLDDNQELKQTPRLIITYDLLFNFPQLLLVLFTAALGYFAISAYLHRVLKKHYDRQLQIEKELKFAEISRQVAHDIKSPLGFLNVFSDQIGPQLGSKAALLDKAISRIKMIVHELEHQKEAAKVLCLNKIVKSAVEEKTIEMNSIEDFLINFEPSAEDPIIKFEESSMKRILSNLFNNSAEAGATIIDIKLTSDDQFVTLRIADNGKGIEKENLTKILDKGFSSKNSKGLGLFHAAHKIEEYSGTLRVQSEPNQGVQIEMVFPKQKKRQQ